MNNDPKHASAALDPEACWRVLERVAASPALKRAARLREFLLYVGAKSLKEGRTDIHEQEIGHAVFDRRDSYDTSQDNIVRVSATELRKRVEAYFASEGRDEPLIFDIPRGTYMPCFRLRTVETPPAPDGAEQPAAAPTQAPIPIPVSHWLQLLLAFVSLVAIVLGVSCVSLWRQNHALTRRIYIWKDQPALAAFWSRFFASPQETDVVLASIASRNGGSFADFRVAERIMALDPGAANVLLEYARDYTADDLKRNNAILIGSRKSNPWIDLFSDQLNFDLEYDRDLDQTLVKNLHPRAGEQAAYAQPADPSATLGYSVIAFLPNPGHTANGLILEGTNSEATNAAGDFITSEQSMQSFLSKLPGKKFTYFELLLKTSRAAGTPLQAEIVAYRTY